MTPPLRSGPLVGRVLRIATRTSALARWQAEHVGGLLAAAHPGLEVELVAVDTAGDVRVDVPLHAIGGRGVFVKEVQQAVLDGRADCAVHSAKDLPASSGEEGLAIAAVPERGDPRDALVGRALDDLQQGAMVATGSVRRRAQLERLRPDLRFVDLRGNIHTRLAKLPEGGALVMAAAALDRLGLAARASEILAPGVMVPQVGQGALAVECRSRDSVVRGLLEVIDHPASRLAVETERAYLGELGGGCDLPVGAHAEEADAGDLRLRVFLAADGTHHRAEMVVPAGEAAARARLAARDAEAAVRARP